MFGSKKEDKGSLPDLPPLRHPLNKQNEEDYDFDKALEKNELPSFPDFLSDKGFSQSAIKDAVEGDKKVVGIPEVRKFGTVEMEEWEPEPLSEPPKSIERFNEDSPKSIPNFRSFSRESNLPEVKKNADIFVKLDKFYSARKALVDVEQKLEDMDELLKKIREIKMREEQELTGWEKEVGNVKARLNDITLNLFEKID